MPAITLEALARAARHKRLNLTGLSRDMGWSPDALRVRLLRGSPPLSAGEAARLENLLSEDGIYLTRPTHSEDHHE